MILARKPIVFLGAILMTCATIVAQDEAKKDPPVEKKEGRIRGFLPTYWKSLGLSDDQKQSVYKVQAKYRSQIEELEAKILELKAQEKKELESLLTPAQKDRLREILLEKAPKGETPPKKD